MKIQSLLLGVAAAAALAAASLALAETPSEHHMPPDAGATMPSHHSDIHTPGMTDHSSMMEGTDGAGVPTMPGQDAFGTVQEIVRILEADPKTDWTKVNLAELREHLIDMDEVTLRAAATEHPIEGGIEIAVTGSGRTLEAIRRMVPAQAQQLNGLHGWAAQAKSLADGVQLTVTSPDANEVAHICGLGFIGLLASGSHHQLHHLAMAKGERHIH